MKDGQACHGLGAEDSIPRGDRVCGNWLAGPVAAHEAGDTTARTDVAEIVEFASHARASVGAGVTTGKEAVLGERQGRADFADGAGVPLGRSQCIPLCGSSEN